jgi:nucleoid DNA-binding protein
MRRWQQQYVCKLFDNLDLPLFDTRRTVSVGTGLEIGLRRPRSATARPIQLDTNSCATYTWSMAGLGDRHSKSDLCLSQENRVVTKKEIVKTISEEIGMTQLKTKEIVQKTFDAIVETLVEERRIELRNFGVFEVKKRAARKARNPRTGDKVFVPEKYVVTFKPGKEMEERVRELERQAAARALAEANAAEAAASGNSSEPESEPLSTPASYGNEE